MLAAFFRCLAVVARVAQALPTGNVIPASPVAADLAAMHDRRDVIGVGLSPISTDPPAVLALPRVASENREPPGPMPVVAIPTGCRVRTVGLSHTR